MNDANELGRWLPDPLPPENDPSWDGRVARILATAEPELQRMAGPAQMPGRAPTETEALLAEMGRWWKPVATLAAAAVAFLVLVVENPRPGPDATGPDAMALTIVASDGDPTAIWAALGVPADPVLALLTLEDHSMSAASADTTPGGAPR